MKEIGRFWYRTFDVSGMIFRSLQTFNKLYRYSFYFFLTVSINIFMIVASMFIDVNNYVESDLVVELVNYVGVFILNVVTALTSLIFTYESIINDDMTNYMHERKIRLQKIAAEKKQWWRLRNMSIKKRWFLYVFIIFTLSYILQIVSWSAFLVTYPVVTQDLLDTFQSELRYITLKMAGIFFFIFAILEHFVIKNRAKVSR